MKDDNLRWDVIAALEYEPAVDSASIGVVADEGVITLTGHVPTYAQKGIAENTVRRVKGVRGIVENLDVRWISDPYDDDDIAKRALTLLDANVQVPAGKVLVKVERGWITLTGEVQWEFERCAAMADLRKLRGVMGLTNSISIKPNLSASNVVKQIEEALKRHAQVEAHAVKVSVEGDRVRLEGCVHTALERQLVEDTAWAAPGVRHVEDRVLVDVL